MVKITGITATPYQNFTIPDPNGGGDISFSLYYRPRTQNWYADISFKTFTLNGQKLVRGPNVLSRHINQIPFGLAVNVADNFEPFLINDFTTGRVGLYLLTSAEVAQIDMLIQNGATPA